MDRFLYLRITVLRPPAGVAFLLQSGKADLLSPTHVSEDRLSFDFTVRVIGDRNGGPPVFRGPLTQGPPAARFIYVNSGTLAGQADSCWTRRAKVPLTSISWDLIEEALSRPGTRLEARIEGTARDGGPACATVPLLNGGWSLQGKH